MTALLYTLLVTHITIVCVTLFLHRGQAHRSSIFGPVLGHAMRVWLWLTTGMVTREWVAVHRAHHRHSDQTGDPHSPHVWGIWRVLFGGALLYRKASQDRVLVDAYGKGTPDDWIEHQVYARWPWLGVSAMLVIDLMLFGAWGLAVWLVQMIWIPLWAAGVINGIGHWYGYQNGFTRDSSRNIVAWGVIVGGEELHNNHHLDPASAKLSRRWFEFDIGWMYIKVFEMLGLLKITSKLP